MVDDDPIVSEVLMDEVKEEMRLSREAHFDLRSFIREITRRSEIVMSEMVERLTVVGDQLVRVGERLGDLGDQTRANTQAVLRVLDRLEPRTG